MITVRVQQINFESNEIISIKLYPLDGKLLPIFNSGAHIDFHLPNGKTRQYSLISPLQDRSYYEIAVLKDSQSKGGSKFIHDKLNTRFTKNKPKGGQDCGGNEVGRCGGAFCGHNLEKRAPALGGAGEAVRKRAWLEKAHHLHGAAKALRKRDI